MITMGSSSGGTHRTVAHGQSSGSLNAGGWSSNRLWDSSKNKDMNTKESWETGSHAYGEPDWRWTAPIPPIEV